MHVRKINYNLVTKGFILVRFTKTWCPSYLCYICHTILQTFFTSSTKKLFYSLTAVLRGTGKVCRAFRCSKRVMGSK